MYSGVKVLDVHQHIVAPAAMGNFRNTLGTLRWAPREFRVSDDQMEQSCQEHLRYCDERNIDCLFVSPRTVGMMHWEQLFLQQKWAEATNNVMDQQHRLHPDRIFGVAQLPQNVNLDTRHCVAELERCFKDLHGFVAAIVNPDPGSDGEYPPMNHEHWYPLYEKAQELDAVLIVHPSFTRDKWDMWGSVPHNYQMNFVIQEFISWNVLEHSEVFDVFPRLKVVICHCGGSLSRFSGYNDHRLRKERTGNLYFDTCAYDRQFLETAIKQWGTDHMMFGTEAPGSGRRINPETGRSDDDLVPMIDSFGFLSPEEKIAIVNTNIKQAFTHFKEPDEVKPAAPVAAGTEMRWGSGA